MTRVKVTQATKLDFGRDEHGGIAIMFAAMLMAIALMIGVGIDTSRLMLTRRTMQDAVDGASLAAVKILVAEGGTPQAVADAIATGTAYFNANIASVRNTVSSIPAPVIVPDANTSTVVVTSRIGVPMAFMAVGGFTNVAVETTSTASLAAKDIEIGMALDVTGSMNDRAVPTDPTSKIAALKVAFQRFTQAVMPATPQPHHSVRVGVAPFATAVNLGRTYAQLASNFRSTDNCVTERRASTSTYTYSDASTQVGGYFQVAADGTVDIDPTEGIAGYNCPAPSVMALTDDRNALVNHVNGFTANFGTAGHLGTQWGWNLIAEDFGSFWGGNSVPAPYSLTQGSHPTLVKAMILMTDGIFNTAYHNTTARDQALALCDAMKAKGVVVFTIGFGLGTTPAELIAKQTLRTCASTGPEFFADASNANDLDAALQQFATILGKLRVSH